MTSDRQSTRRAGGRAGPRRGWLLVATLAVAETTSYGVLAYAFGVFLVPMGDDLGWSRTALTGAFAMAVIVSGVAAIPVGRWLDGHGARTLMAAGSAGATLLVLAWAQVSDLTVFYVIWTGIGLTMAAVLYDPAFVVIATWFHDDIQRRKALLTLTVIAGFASVIYVPLAGWLVQAHGWRHALIVLAALLGILTIIPNAPLPAAAPTSLPVPPTQTPPLGRLEGPGSRWDGRCATRRCGGWPRPWSLPRWPPPPSPSTWSPTCASSTTRPAWRPPGPGSLVPARSAGASWSPPSADAGRWPAPPRPSSPSKPSPSPSWSAYRDRPGWSRLWACLGSGSGSSPWPEPSWSPRSTA